MIDRAAGANFLAGGMFGGALLIAAVVLALAILIPIGRPDWPAFARGAIIVPGLVIVVFGAIVALMWVTSDKT